MLSKDIKVVLELVYDSNWEQSIGNVYTNLPSEGVIIIDSTEGVAPDKSNLIEGLEVIYDKYNPELADAYLDWEGG